MRGTKEVKFIFICPNEKRVFESSVFQICDNRGVATAEDGNRTLDAKVALNESCPFCGRKHVYQASELSCPFTAKKRTEFETEKMPMKVNKKIRLTETVTGSG